MGKASWWFGSTLAMVAVAAPAAVPQPGAPTPAVARPGTGPAPVPPATRPAPVSPAAPATAAPDALAPMPEGVAEAELPPPVWSAADARQLYDMILGIGREGLDPLDYAPSALAQALAAGEGAELNAAATDSFNRLSHDLALGHVRDAARIDWHVIDNDLPRNRQRWLLETALAQHRVAEALAGLAPTHPQYGALRHALEVTPKTEVAKRNRIRLNMDRWRWLPRDLGDKYIIVNVPSFHATLVENGVTRWKNRAIAGAIKTPTPQLSVVATGVILNPWWEVPPSISGEVAGKPGFVAVKGADGKVQRWRQPPGPSNALGELKFVMQNPQNIYLHDTNARSRFNSEVRALSHGCIRTQHVVDLATALLADDGGEWSQDRIRETLQSKKTVEAKFVKPVPVFIVYFSSAALLDGTIVDYQDLYNRDGKVIAELVNRGPAPAATAARPGAAKPRPAARSAATPAPQRDALAAR